VTSLALLPAGLLFAGLLAGPPDAPVAQAVAAEPDVSIDAGSIGYEVDAERYRLLGGARIQRGDAVLQAGEATYDAVSGEIVAGGGVLLTDPTRAVAAERIRAVLGGAFEADGVRAFLKVAPADLSGVETADGARAAGRNALSLSGERLSGDASGRLRLLGARLTLCDCGAGAPSWEVRAREADVVPGVRAVLSRPVVYVTPRFLGVSRPVPVLWLPWLYVPLGDRQTGVLLPELRASRSGQLVALPIFVTLGRSADLTLAPQLALLGDQVRGPGASLELRWAPAAEAAGRVELTAVNDLRHEPAGADGSPGVSGGRFFLEGSHAQRAGPSTHVAARLALASDPQWARDLSADALAREAGYQRSSLLASHRRDAYVLEAGAAWLQPLGGLEASYGRAFGADLDGAHRLPGLSAVLLPEALGPLVAEGRVGLTRLAPFEGGADVLGRAAASRADGRVEVAAPFLLGDVLSVRPYVRGAGAAYAFEDGADPAASGWGLAGVALSTEVSRRFGALRHAVTPRLEWRAGSSARGELIAGPGYDAFDRPALGLLSAAPPGAFHQLRLAVETRLSAPAATPVRLEVGQDLDLRSGRAGETFVVAALAAGPVAAEGVARFLAIDGRAAPAPEPSVPSELDRFTELRATAALALGQRGALRGGILAIGPGASSELVTGPDALFDLRPADVRAAGAATVGARAVLGPATLDYDALLEGRPRIVQRCNDPARRVAATHVRQHRGAIAWDSPCRCFRIALTAHVDDCGEFGGGATVELSRPSAVR
jgi:LPS-assembly protein